MDTTGWVDADGKATRRIWRTIEGAYVPEGDGNAAFLAYGEGQEISPVDLTLLRQVQTEGPTAKMAPKPEDKSLKPSANKGA